MAAHARHGHDARGRARPGALAIVVTALAFAAMHVLAAPWPPATGTLLATIGVGVGCGILSFTTARLGGAILAHAVFNASGLAIAFLA